MLTRRPLSSTVCCKMNPDSIMHQNAGDRKLLRRCLGRVPMTVGLHSMCMRILMLSCCCADIGAPKQAF